MGTNLARLARMTTHVQSDRPETMVVMFPALYGSGKDQEGNPTSSFVHDLKDCCEDFQINPDGSWYFRADICTPETIKIFDGELLDLLTAKFRTLMDLRYFEGGTFKLEVPFSPFTLQWLDFSPQVISMCSALGVAISVYTVGTDGRLAMPLTPQPLPPSPAPTNAAVSGNAAAGRTGGAPPETP